MAGEAKRFKTLRKSREGGGKFDRLTNSDDRKSLVCKDALLSNVAARPIWAAVPQPLAECNGLYP